ncbi:unnamed protein product [Cylicocyclus nassatus]|uniref:Tyrosine-protein kinase n=1 Tax=Cylicocyclus nassatus TaxID=53992 RepID=A0AA36GIS1_CYLNA|nr:unnamed protein product [Cylicocyclus nassatus]
MMCNIEEKDYYHGLLRREDLDELFKKGGDYLVRMGETKEGEAKDFIVSISLCSKNKKQLKHFVISRTPHGFSVDNVNFFPDIVQLIEYYSVRKVGLNGILFQTEDTVLKRPICRASWELTHGQVELGEKLGEGHFGSLMKGKLTLNNTQRHIDVAVKTAKKECSENEIAEVLKEARIMRNMIYPHIVRLYGVAVDKEPILIVMELMANGDLKSFMRKKPSNKKQKLCWTAQAAYGLDYLHSRHFIHRDIAARNCLLSKNLTLKIADFGLAREGDVYTVATRRKLPVKWISPEVLENNVFSLKSDVWSFGILVWEIMTNGATPYEGLPNAKVKEMMLQGKHNKFPPDTNSQVVELVQSCWLRDPAYRCTMREAAKFMANLTGIPQPPMSTYASKELISRTSSSRSKSSSCRSRLMSKRNTQCRANSVLSRRKSK